MEKSFLWFVMLLVAAVLTVMVVFSADGAACLSLAIIIGGLVIIGVQTGAASATSGAESYANTAMISEEIVERDSRTRWRKKSLEEYGIGLVLMVVGAILFLIMAIVNFVG